MSDCIKPPGQNAGLLFSSFLDQKRGWASMKWPEGPGLTLCPSWPFLCSTTSFSYRYIPHGYSPFYLKQTSSPEPLRLYGIRHPATTNASNELLFTFANLSDIQRILSAFFHNPLSFSALFLSLIMLKVIWYVLMMDLGPNERLRTTKDGHYHLSFSHTHTQTVNG